MIFTRMQMYCKLLHELIPFQAIKQIEMEILFQNP